MTLTFTCDIDIQSYARCGLWHTHMQKFIVNGHSVSKIEWKQTVTRTDGGDCITSLASAVDKYVH